MKLRPFELALIIGFGLLMVVALFLLSTAEPGSDTEEEPFGSVVIWGTLPSGPMAELLRALGDKNENFRTVSYRYVEPERFSGNLVEAIADGRSPDLLLISHEELTSVTGRIQNIPFPTTLADYRSQFVDGAEIFTNTRGYFGYPIAVDPLMLYWNRDLFSANGLVTAPLTWEEIISDTIPSVVRINQAGLVTQPAVALGEQSNVNNYLPIVSMLLLQAGSNMVVRDERGRYEIRLNAGLGDVSRPLTQVATFYANFSAKTNTLYTWDASLPLDREAFVANNLGMYFGFGSELKHISERNPNLNFDVAAVPQGAGASTKRTYGKFYALSVASSARNKTGAYKVFAELTSPATAKKIADAQGMAPANRSSLSAGSGSEYGARVYSSALFARGWYNPDITRTREIFSVMIDEVNDNRASVSSAVGDALDRLEQAYR